MRYHVDFCNALDQSLRNPWMLKDQWTIADGSPPAVDHHVVKTAMEQEELHVEKSERDMDSQQAAGGRKSKNKDEQSVKI